jgi:hypothetical protein
LCHLAALQQGHGLKRVGTCTSMQTQVQGTATNEPSPPGMGQVVGCITSEFRHRPPRVVLTDCPNGTEAGRELRPTGPLHAGPLTYRSFYSLEAAGQHCLQFVVRFLGAWLPRGTRMERRRRATRALQLRHMQMLQGLTYHCFYSVEVAGQKCLQFVASCARCARTGRAFGSDRWAPCL